MQNLKGMQEAIVQSADGSMRRLAVVPRSDRTVYLCSRTRYRAITDHAELENYAVGFPSSDVTFEDEPGFAALEKRAS